MNLAPLAQIIPIHHDYASSTIAIIHKAYTLLIAPLASTHRMPFRNVTAVSKKCMAARSAEASTTPPLEGRDQVNDSARPSRVLRQRTIR
jgi:hypothetical protein